MKNMIQLFVLILLFFVIPTKGASGTTGSTLPPSLPMGSEEIWLDYVATNYSHSLAAGLTYTNMNGDEWTLYSSKWEIRFSTTEQMLEYIYDTVLKSRDTILSKYNPNLNADTRLEVVSYHTFDPYVIFASRNSVGKITEITRQKIQQNLKFQYYNLIIKVPDLKYYCVDVPMTRPYKHIWSINPSESKTIRYDSYPVEGTTNGIVYLNYWYCMPTNATRITIGTSTSTNVYTQYGKVLGPSRLEMESTQKLKVHGPAGAFVTLQSSTDLRNWSTFTTATISSNGCGVVNTPVNDRMFFRQVSVR